MGTLTKMPRPPKRPPKPRKPSIKLLYRYHDDVLFTTSNRNEIEVTKQNLKAWEKVIDEGGTILLRRNPSYYNKACQLVHRRVVNEAEANRKHLLAMRAWEKRVEEWEPKHKRYLEKKEHYQIDLQQWNEQQKMKKISNLRKQLADLGGL